MQAVLAVLDAGELELAVQLEHEAAVAAEYLPASQSPQLIAAAAAYFPAPHPVQSPTTVAPAEARCFPAAHGCTYPKCQRICE